jgi:hypothetical protein
MFLRKEGHRPENFIVPILEQYFGKHVIGRVGLQDDFFFSIEWGQDRCGCKSVL